ncbi:hypothetical protein Leryth_016584 [Lithospermum erythrorhizon]|nr:hypothetical protein Leryth_016584 [Lithospermum erythrorhizon]
MKNTLLLFTCKPIPIGTSLMLSLISTFFMFCYAMSLSTLPFHGNVFLGLVFVSNSLYTMINVCYVHSFFFLGTKIERT